MSCDVHQPITEKYFASRDVNLPISGQTFALRHMISMSIHDNDFNHRGFHPSISKPLNFSKVLF